MKLERIMTREAQFSARAGAMAAATIRGTVAAVSQLCIEVAGVDTQVRIGSRIRLTARDGRAIAAEIVGFHGRAQAMAFADIVGVGAGSGATLTFSPASARAPDLVSSLAPHESWLGRVIDPLGSPLDQRGPICNGSIRRPVHSSPPDAISRGRLGARLDLGVQVLNLFATCREGQRVGIFAGSGVGKSSLLAMLARFAACDVIVVALVGERGREVREFLEDDLGQDGLARSVVVTATSDSQPLMRREAAYAAMTVAEHFRDQGKSVLLLMDSLTRFCGALREIGLSAGEPPATRAYPPSVFAELPRLLERAGPGIERLGHPTGNITAFFTVLVEGDDHNEPVADAVRGILDGHIVLDRQIAEMGRFPAVDVLRSLSRSANGCLTEEETALIRRARSIIATYAGVADLLRLGAYKSGTDAAVDEAVLVAPVIQTALTQKTCEMRTLDDNFSQLAESMRLDNGS